MKSKLIALIFSVVLVLSTQVCPNIDKIKDIIYNRVDITQPLAYEPFGKIYSEHGIDFKLAHYFPECMLYKYYIPEKCDRSFPHFIEQEGGSVQCLTGHANYIHQIIQLNAQYIASSSADKTIKIWDLEANECIATLEGHTGTVCDIVKIDGNRIASCSHDGSIKIWDLASHSCLTTLNAHPKNCSLHMTSLADGNIVSCAGDGIKIWDPISGKCIAHYTVNNGWVSYATQLIDGRIAVNHSSQQLGSCAMMKIFDLYPRDLSFEQIALIVHLEKYFEQEIPVVLGDGWRNVFEMLPQYFQNRFESIMQVCKL